MKTKKCNGNKVCYREQGSKQYICYFITYTLRQAKYARYSYMRYPPKARHDNHTLKNPIWKIIPIKNSEIRDGIWREIPF